MPSVKTPLNKNFFKYLKKRTSHEQACTLVYRQNDGSSVKLNAMVVDLFSWQGNHYVLLDKGQLIRLDRLISVNDYKALS